MLHFIRVYTVCKGKEDLQTKEYNFLKYNLTSPDMYIDYPNFVVSNQKEESINIQRVKSNLDVCPLVLFSLQAYWVNVVLRLRF